MKIWKAVKRFGKKIKKGVQVAVLGVCVALVQVPFVQAAIDTTAIQAAFATAITDITAVALVIASFFAGIFGIKEIIRMIKSRGA